MKIENLTNEELYLMLRRIRPYHLSRLYQQLYRLRKEGKFLFKPKENDSDRKQNSNRN